MLLVDVPTFAREVWSAGRDFNRAMTLQREIRAELEQIARTRADFWFCDGCQTPPKVFVTLEHIFDQQKADELPDPEKLARVGDHPTLRHIRYAFRVDSNPAADTLSVRPGMQCEVTHTLNRLLKEKLGGVAEKLYVARTCDATLQQTRPARFTRTPHGPWHLKAVGAPANKTMSGGPVNDGAVHVAIMDTVADGRVAADLHGGGLDLPAGASLSMAPASMHGTAMGMFVRQMAANAEVLFLNALGESGAAPIGQLAQALLHTHHIYSRGRFTGRPLVVNMSLGWAAEDRMRSKLRGGWSRHQLNEPDGPGLPVGCELDEDPVGESVRLALIGLRKRSERTTTLVYAAAGNRILSPPAQHPGESPTDDPAETITDITNSNARLSEFMTDDMLYPANWSRRLTGISSLNGKYRLAEGVGQIGPRNPTPRHTNLRLETPIVAPGAFVPISLPAANGPQVWDTDASCSNATPSAGGVLPTSYSGTSVSTALVSGIVADALEVHESRNAALGASGRAPVISPEHMTFMLHFSGLKCGSVQGNYLAPTDYDIDTVPTLFNNRPDPARYRFTRAIPVRTIEQRLVRKDRLLAMISEPGCVQAVLNTPVSAFAKGPDKVDPAQLNPIKAACALPSVAYSCAGAEPTLAKAAQPAPLCAGQPTLTVSATPGDIKREKDPIAAGTAGPQPVEPPCPDGCRAFIFNQGQDRMLGVEFMVSPKLNISQVKSVQLWLLGQGGFLAAPPFKLVEDPTAVLSPGKTVRIEPFKVGSVDDDLSADMDFRLVTEIQTNSSGGLVAIDQPLTVLKVNGGW